MSLSSEEVKYYKLIARLCPTMDLLGIQNRKISVYPMNTLNGTYNRLLFISFFCLAKYNRLMLNCILSESMCMLMDFSLAMV